MNESITAEVDSVRNVNAAYFVSALSVAASAAAIVAAYEHAIFSGAPMPQNTVYGHVRNVQIGALTLIHGLVTNSLMGETGPLESNDGHEMDPNSVDIAVIREVLQRTALAGKSLVRMMAAMEGGELDLPAAQTSFQLVADMNNAFGNPKGDPANIDWARLEKQCMNIADEHKELMDAIAARDLDAVRDALCDIHVFAYGGHHFLGIDADDDMRTTVSAVMTRFVKDEADLEATKAMHAAKGVTETYTEGEFPRMILKSAVDQPDAPKGKFLKSASYRQPEFKAVV